MAMLHKKKKKKKKHSINKNIKVSLYWPLMQDLQADAKATATA